MPHWTSVESCPRKNSLTSLGILAFTCSLLFAGQVASGDYTGLVNLDSRTTVSSGRYYLDRSTGCYCCEATITNTSGDPIQTPLVLAFSNIPSGATLVSDGSLPDGTPYVDFTDKIPTLGVLAAGATTQVRIVAFQVSGRVRLSPTMSVWGRPPISVTCSASPASGPIPLTVAFSATPSGSVVLYEWDFEGDGTYDWSSATTGSTSHTYATVGSYTAMLRVTDGFGSTATNTVTITAQASLEARPSATPTNGLAPLTVYFSTDGYDPVGTIVIFRWDFDGNGSWDTYDTVARDYTHVYSTSGTYNATLLVQSSTGATASASLTINVGNNPPKATADVVPSNGEVPLTVQMIGSGTDSDGSVVLYEWDFEGDGTYDWSSTTTGNTGHTYTVVGTYQAVFRVTDNAGLTTTAMAITTVINAGPPGSPTATASASPTSGNAPLTVNFSGTATDPDNDIVLYEWDFDGDGAYDWSSPTSASTSHVYTQAGTNIAALRVTDATSLTGVDHITIYVNLTTTLSIANNTVGFPQGSTGMTASASSQYSSSYAPSNAIDGSASTAWYTAAYQTPYYGVYTYFEVTFGAPQKVRGLSVNSYYSYRFIRGRIELYDNAGNSLYTTEQDFPNAVSTFSWSEVQNVSRIRLVALQSSPYYVMIYELTVDSTPMASSGEPEPQGTNINTTISADTNVSVYIKDDLDNRIRTLVSDQARSMGSYSDYWDCRDDAGFVVNDGLYYAILAYRLEDQWQTLDLTDSTGGTRYEFPFGSGVDQRDSFTDGYTFSPFADQQMAMTFRLSKAQEVTAFIGPLWTGSDPDRIRTIVNRQAFPGGKSTIYWDGLDDQGNVAEPPAGDYLITGFWRYSLPNNAMYMTGGTPDISSVSAEDNYFSPFSEKCDSQGQDEGVTLTFTLSEDTQYVELRVYSVTTSALLRTLRVHGLGAGEHSIYWDGKNNNGEYVDIGDYRLGVIAKDADGNESMLRYTLVRIDY
jgi:PKD repeat protein